MKRILLPCLAAVLWALAGPAAAEPGKPAGPRGDSLGEPLGGLARQIGEINANIANLRSGSAAAVRLRSASLAAFQRAWARLTRDEVDFVRPADPEAVAALAGARP